MSLRNLVKYPVKYYSWQDDQAPQLSDADGVIKTILKACLVTGYGSKQGAGWTALFEDVYRIVLRRPLRTGNPPDIKIENGVINGATSHRIVAQDNPASLDDSNELSAVNLLARDAKCGREWHCIVTDFAIILCYQMGENGSTGDRNSILIIGGAKKLLDSDNEYFFVTNYSAVAKTGLSSVWLSSLLYNNATQYTHGLYDMRRKINFTSKLYLDIAVAEKYFGNDYLAQKIIVDKVAELPLFCSLPTQYDNLTTAQVTIGGRPMLRYVNKNVQVSYGPRALYIPLDYWEL